MSPLVFFFLSFFLSSFFPPLFIFVNCTGTSGTSRISRSAANRRKQKTAGEIESHSKMYHFFPRDIRFFPESYFRASFTFQTRKRSVARSAAIVARSPRRIANRVLGPASFTRTAATAGVRSCDAKTDWSRRIALSKRRLNHGNVRFRLLEIVPSTAGY